MARRADRRPCLAGADMLEPELADGVVAVAGHPARQSGRLSSLSFSMLWIIGYPHVINRYRPRGVVLTTFIKLFLFDAG